MCPVASKRKSQHMASAHSLTARSSNAGISEQQFIAFCQAFVGLPYVWGGDGPDTYDCSGLIQALLARLGLDPAGDQTAHDLYRWFQQRSNGIPMGEAVCGCLAFFGKPRRIGHVSLCLGNATMIEAAHGGPEMTTVERARAQGAKVEINPISRRNDLVALIRPVLLPWS